MVEAGKELTAMKIGQEEPNARLAFEEPHL